MCPQGMNMPFIPTAMLSQHTVQVGASTVPCWFFLQCLFSIFTIGSFLTDSSYALLFLALFCASCSLIALAISMKASSEEKFLLKFVMKLSGENPWKTVFILKNSCPENIP